MAQTPKPRRRASNIERADQARNAASLRRSGMTCAMIADELGLTLSVAKRRIAAGYQHELGDGATAETLRSEVEDRLDQALRRIQRRLDDPEITARDEARWIRLMLQVEQTRIRLLGLNIPPLVVIRSEAELVDSDPIEETVY